MTAPDADPAAHADDPADWARREALLDTLLDLPEPERPAFLDRIAVSDPADAAALRDWLAGIARAGHGYLAPAGDDRPGQVIGNWRLLRLIGRGGMGEVWLGERADGLFAKRVAIKVIRDDRPQLARHIESERRLLAALQHPGIVRLLDAGSTGDGHPFLVTDYIDGLTLDAWLRERQPSLPRRLALFGQIVAAVAHAHEHLVVHRDIKPGNVLVGTDGNAHLLDFGIAGALASEHDDSHSTQVAMTPAYAAPELLTDHRTSVRSDVYALGGLLYFLLCGQAPLELAGLPMARLLEVVRLTPPQAPSRRRAGDDAAGPSWLLADLDAIALKALAKAPGERYASATALLADIEAAQARRPIAARAPSLGDRLRRLWARQRTPIAVTALLLASLVAGLIGTLVQAREARLQRDRAEAEAARANEEARIATSVRNYLVDVYRSADPSSNGGQVPTARELVDAGVRRIDGELAAHPTLQAQLLEAMATTYSGLGENALALATMRRARELAVTALDETAPTAARISVNLAKVVTEGSHELHGEEILPMLERLVASDTLRDAPEIRVGALNQLGLMQQSLGDAAAGLERLRQAVAIGEAASPAADIELAEAYANLSLALSRDKRVAEATQAIEASLALRLRQFGPDAVATATSQINLANLLALSGRFDEAEKHMDAGVRTYRKTYGEQHNQYAWSLRRLATLRMRQGRSDPEVEDLLLRSLAISTQSQGEDSVDVSETLNTLAALKLAQMRIDEAIGYQQQVVAYCHRVYGTDSPMVQATTLGLAGLHVRAGDLTHGETLLEAILADQQRSGYGDVAAALYWLGQARRLRDDPAGALARHRQALDHVRENKDERDEFVARIHLALAADLRMLGDVAGAREHIDQARADSDTTPVDALTGTPLDAAFLLAQFDAEAGRCAEALPALRAARSQRQQLADTAPARTLRAEADFFLARCQGASAAGEARDRLQDAARVLAESATTEPHLRRLAQQALAIDKRPRD